MKLIILGTCHCLQEADQGLKQCIESLIETKSVTLIGEEYLPTGIAARVASSRRIPWIPIDMTHQEKQDAGIGDLATRRLQYRANNFLPNEVAVYATKGDGIREESWLTKIENASASGTVLLICGAVHLKSLTERAERRGHQVCRRLYPETLSELPVKYLPEPG